MIEGVGFKTTILVAYIGYDTINMLAMAHAKNPDGSSTFNVPVRPSLPPQVTRPFLFH